MEALFRGGNVRKIYNRNMDETHFDSNIDIEHNFDIKGKTKVNYVDAVSGVQRMTIVLLISLGCVFKMEYVILIFCKQITNQWRSRYPPKGNVLFKSIRLDEWSSFPAMAERANSCVTTKCNCKSFHIYRKLHGA